MPKPTKGPRLGGSSSHQKALLANLATSLFEHGRIKTTEPKARALRPYAEKLITHAKKGTLHNRREVMKKIRDKDIVHVLFAEIPPTLAAAKKTTSGFSSWKNLATAPWSMRSSSDLVRTIGSGYPASLRARTIADPTSPRWPAT